MNYNLNNDEIMGNEKSFLKLRSNGMMLSDNDIDILNRNGINYLDYKNLSELLFRITEVINENGNEELDNLSIKLGEYNYYNYTNK